MKKIFALPLSALCLTLSVTAFADFKNPSVNDNAGFLTQEEVTELTQTIDNIRNVYDIDVAIVTETEMSGSDAESTADDMYDYEGYGAGDNADGIMLYVSEEPRSYHMTTHGSGITYFTDSKLIYLEDSFLPYLKNDDYYSAFDEFALKCDEILYEAHNDTSDGNGSESVGYPYDLSEGGAKDEMSVSHIPPYAVGVVLILPLLIAFIATRIKLSKMNTAVSQNYAANYMKPNSMKLTNSNDLFLYSTVTQTAKPQPHDDDSSTHVSSSGETHGGRGGSY